MRKKYLRFVALLVILGSASSGCYVCRGYDRPYDHPHHYPHYGY